MKRSYTHFFIYFLAFCIISFLFTSCSSSSHNSIGSDPSSSETGSISFNLRWNSNPVSNFRAYSPSGDVCMDYGIEDIEAIVHMDSNIVITSLSCGCTDISNTMNDIPEGSGYSITIEGIIWGEILWRGDITGISVTAGQNTDAGTIDIHYVGGDITPPTVVSITPSNGTTDVSVNTDIIVQFSENIIEALLNSNTFILESDGNIISGKITYDPNSWTATFKPDNPLSVSTIYSATIKKDIQDQSTIEMSGDFSWSFTTDTTGMATLIWDVGNWDETKWDY